MKNKRELIQKFKSITGDKYILTAEWSKEPYSKGWRYGSGKAFVVAKPGTLLEIWNILKICVDNNIIVIMQAANTGLTGGSTPYGNDYDRPILIINTLRIDDIHIINKGRQIIGLAGSTLYDLERKLKPLGREPHSIIGSTSIGASIVGGVCNNSGGSLVKRGPAYTELALYAKVNQNGKLELVNELGINLGSKPKDILNKLQNVNYNKSDIINSDKLASDDKYSEIVRQIDSETPARFNADKRLLYGASGSAGKIIVFAVRLDTYPLPKKSQVFYLGSNDPNVFWQIRRDILSKFKTLPTLGDYLHRDCYDAAKKYSLERKQFDKPIGSFQLIQKKLAEMLTEITKAQLLCWKLGKLMDEGKATTAQISLAKRNNVEIALKIAREARQIHGGMGITNDYPMMRHMMNLESVITYEGTHDIHLLILGHEITGIQAFS